MNTMSDHMTLEYRPDIDGLRALAVLSVLFFHFDVPGFSGGFVGVDIYFVISGYLITCNIRADLHAGHFTFRSFYMRRIRRLLPASIVVCVCVTVLCWLLLSLHHWQHYGASLAAAQLFVANYWFQSTLSYFDITATFKPLLHMWSLSLEEQYYIIWPAFIVMLVRCCRSRHVVLLLCSVAVASLVYAEYLVQQHVMQAFYSMPARVYEFCMGALLAFHTLRLRNHTVWAL